MSPLISTTHSADAPPAYFARTASARQPRKHHLHIAIAIDGGQEGFHFFELLGAQDDKALAQQGTARQSEPDDALEEMAERLK